MRLSVVIPVRGRAETLARTLAALAGQAPPEGGFEVVVVNDGADAAVAGVLAQSTSHFPVRIVALEQAAAGPAAARNLGVAASHGELLLFLGADTRPSDERLVQSHAALHEGRPTTYAVLGRVVWDESRAPATPLMRWLTRSGTQFSFDELSAGPVPVSRYLYGSHVSIARGLLDDVGGFETRFPFAAVEDMELGTRLERLGVELDYHPELVVAHDHPTTLRESLRRAERAGRAAALFAELHPGSSHPDMRAPSAKLKAVTAARPALDAAVSMPLPPAMREQIWRGLHLGAYVRGYRQGPPAP